MIRTEINWVWRTRIRTKIDRPVRLGVFPLLRGRTDLGSFLFGRPRTKRPNEGGSLDPLGLVRFGVLDLDSSHKEGKRS